MVDKKTGSDFSFEQLGVFVGEWRVETLVKGTLVGSGKTTFALIAGGAFLIQHATADPPLPTTPQIWIDNSPFPIVAVISVDNYSGRLYYNYSDARGVHRVYQMSFKDRVWKFWGQAGPKFHQRFEGRFSQDGKKIAVHIEKSADGKSWQTDFHSVYTKL